MRGDAVEVWQGERQIGVAYRYTLAGYHGEWWMEAQKHRLAPGFEGGPCEFRFSIIAGSADLYGQGQFTSEWIADGAVHRCAVQVEGTSLWTTATGQPESTLRAGTGPKLNASPGR